MDTQNIHFENLKYNDENVWIGNIVIKFYHPQNCPNCGFCSPGYNDFRSEGPWKFECRSCMYQWSIAMTDNQKEKRKYLLETLELIDSLIGSAKAIRGYTEK